MSTHTKPCPRCEGTWCKLHGDGWACPDCAACCKDCKGAGRVPDVEAMLRAELDAARADRDSWRASYRAEKGAADELRAKLSDCTERLTAAFRQVDNADAENLRLAAEIERLTGTVLPHNASTQPEFRRDDMGNGKLKVGRDDDGDMYVSLVLPGHGFLSVEFTAPGSGGGKSPRTWAALRALLDAMTADNAEAEP